MKIITVDKKSLIIALTFIVTIGLSYLLGISPLISVMITSLLLHYKTADKAVKNFSLLHLCFLFTITLTSCVLILNVSGKLLYILPVACAPMLVSILFSNQQIALLMNLAGAISVALITRDINLAIILFSGGMIGIVSIKGVRHRAEILKSGILVGITQAFCILLIQNASSLNNTFVYNVGVSLANGFICAAFIMVTLPIFEYIFTVVTNITLLELSDFNHPLLKQLALKAPGTYHHSLIVGNLAEAAAETIEANSLLCRVGAYYHDIGKITKPEYFSENQLTTSKHTKIKPSISRSIILGHVKEGLELAKKYRLRPAIIDFISQHHGTSLMYYFFRRALEQTEENTDNLKEEGFRYPGPRPRSRETAIVLLADSVEAATRALEEPTPPRIEGTVHRILNNKFIDGQLHRCDITLKDIDDIAQTFIRILTAIYHSRIPYPATNE